MPAPAHDFRGNVGEDLPAVGGAYLPEAGLQTSRSFCWTHPTEPVCPLVVGGTVLRVEKPSASGKDRWQCLSLATGCGIHPAELITLTRGDLTIAVRQRDLERKLDEFEGRL